MFLQLICCPTEAIFPKCSQLVQQYFECKHLKMIPYDINKLNNSKPSVPVTWKRYIRDPSVANNSLNESFYEEQLGDMGFSDGLDLIWQIYESTWLNCTNYNKVDEKNELCKCVAFNTFDDWIRIVALFRNAKFYSQVKQVMTDFFDNYDIDRDPKLYTSADSSVKTFCNLHFYNYLEFIRTNRRVQTCIGANNRFVSFFFIL